MTGLSCGGALAEVGFRFSCGGQWVVVRPPELGLLLVVVSMGGGDGGFRVVICFGCGGLQFLGIVVVRGCDCGWWLGVVICVCVSDLCHVNS